MKKLSKELDSAQEKDWLGKESVESSIFDSVDDLAPIKPLALDAASPRSSEDDSGYDPYDTGRFIKNKG